MAKKAKKRDTPNPGHDLDSPDDYATIEVRDAAGNLVTPDTVAAIESGDPGWLAASQDVDNLEIEDVGVATGEEFDEEAEA